MRISGKREDPDYWAFIFKRKPRTFRVELDGKEEPFCTEADDELGYVIVEVIGENGLPVLENDVIKTERKTGKVEFFGEKWEPRICG